MRKRIVILISACFLILIVTLAWVFGYIMVFSLESHIVPAYSKESASLREIMNHVKNELAEQGMNVEIRVLDETGYDEVRIVEGIAGNGYLFLDSVSEVFNTQITWPRHGVIVIYGVGSEKKQISSVLDQ